MRRELARQSGIVIFIGGAKLEHGHLVSAGGVLEEFSLAQAEDAFLLPIGATGGAAKDIANQLLGSSLTATGVLPVRPTDAELQQLSDSSLDSNALAERVLDILRRVTRLN